MIFGPFAPDKAKSGNDGILTRCEGVYALEDGYRPVGQFVTTYAALPAVCKGAASFVNSDGKTTIITGTATELFKAASNAWTSLATGFSIQGDKRWRFAQFGTLAIATNGADAMRKIDLGTAAVSLLGGSPPTTEILAVVKDFLVGGIYNGDVMTLVWSGQNNAEYWTPGQRQSDYSTLPTGGRINGILSGEYGIILQRDRIMRMDYVGGNVIFEINEVSSNIGCVTVHSVAQWGAVGFFYSDEGFMMWNGAPVPIGRELVDRDFASRYNSTDWGGMSTAVDPVNSVVMWAMADRIYCYNWALQRWTIIPIASSIVFSGVTKGITLDEQDPDFGAADDNLDGGGLPSFDDPVYTGGDPQLYLFNSTHFLGTLSGTPMLATFTGNEIEMFRGRRACLRSARPDCDAVAGLTLSFISRQRLGDAGDTTTFNTLTVSGDMPLRVSGRYLRPTVAITAGTTWTYAKGIDFIGEAGAGR
jgi:hypothetical protein